MDYIKKRLRYTRALEGGLRTALGCSATRCCCNNCGDINKYEVFELRRKISTRIARITKQKYIFLRGVGDSVDMDLFDRLSTYLRVVDRMVDLIRYSVDMKKLGYDQNFLSAIKGQIYEIVGNPNSLDRQEQDVTGLQAWILKNPRQVGLKPWKLALYSFPAVFRIEVNEEKREDFADDLYKAISMSNRKKTSKKIASGIKEIDKL